MPLSIVFTTLAILFLALAVIRLGRDGDISHPRTRTWLLVGFIFGVVSAYLFFQGV